MNEFIDWITVKVDELENEVRSLIEENYTYRAQIKRREDQADIIRRALRSKVSLTEAGNISINMIFKDDSLYSEFLEFFDLKEGGTGDDV